MILHIEALARPASVDIADLTAAKRTGDPSWVGPGELLIPLDREPPATEAAAIKRRLTTADSEEEALQAAVEAHEGTPESDLAALRIQVEQLTRLVLKRGQQSSTPAPLTETST